MSNVFPPNKDIHETYDLKVSRWFLLFALLSKWVIGVNIRSVFTRRRNSQESICSHEGSQLGKETKEAAIRSTKEKTIYWSIGPRCHCKY